MAPDGCQLLPLGLPDDWLGANFEVHDLPAGEGGRASFALRWHGERPAVLWESTAPLTAPVLAPTWSTAAGAERGEALWPAPSGRSAPTALTGEGGISFG